MMVPLLMRPVLPDADYRLVSAALPLNHSCHGMNEPIRIRSVAEAHLSPSASLFREVCGGVEV
jgi:hypothetical protein